MGGFLPMIFQLVGYAVGGPVGAVIGSLVGAVLFGTQSGSSEGPRARDLKVQSSAYGTAIAIVWGCARLAGNIFWSSGIHEIVKRETSGGGILGGGATLTLYSYTTDLAIGICEGEIGEVRRIWANGRLIYDRTGTSDRAIPQGFQVTIYRGTEDQAPDPYMAANRDGKDVGGGLGVDGQPVAGPVPAYRGTAYALIKNFDLEPFGNQVPSFEFEVVNGEPQPARMDRLALPWAMNRVAGGAFVHDPVRNKLISSDSSGTRVAVIDPVTMQVESEIETDLNTWNFSFDATSGMIVSTSNEALSSGQEVTVTDVYAGTTSYFNISLPRPEQEPFTHVGPATWNPLNQTAGHDVIVTTNGGLVSGPTFYGNSDPAGEFPQPGAYIWQVFNLPPGLWAWRLSTIEVVQTLGVIAMSSALIGRALALHRMDRGGQIGVWPDFFNGLTHHWAYDSSRDRLWFAQREQENAGRWIIRYFDFQGHPPGEEPPPEAADSVHAGWVIWKTLELSEASGNIVFAYNATFDAIVVHAYPAGSNIFGGIVTLYSVAGAQVISQTPSGQEIQFQTYGSFAYSHEGYLIARALNANDETLLGKLYFGTPLSADGEDLAVIVSNLCARAGLPPDDIDVTELTDKVRGYVVARPMTVRAAIEPLMSAYFFDGVETGGDPPGPE